MKDCRSSCSLALFVSISILVCHSNLIKGNFHESMFFNWGFQCSAFENTGEDATLILDQTSGSGIQTKRTFLYGSFGMLIKLVPGDSAGTVTAFYLSSTGNKHDEIDFEFLGNETGQPYIIHTNLHLHGAGGREQQFYPWFDPTEDYHNYTIHWTPSVVVWYVDSIPIRVYKNYESEGIPFPNQQGMRAYSSIWNGDSWATRGGQAKINWGSAPFVVRLRHFNAKACEYDGLIRVPSGNRNCAAHSSGEDHNPNSDFVRAETESSNDKKVLVETVRENFMIYDYCEDYKKYKGLMPGECLKPQY